jgi:hypothetical protein
MRQHCFSRAARGQPPPPDLPPHKCMAAFSSPCGVGKHQAPMPVTMKPVAATAQAMVGVAEGGEPGAMVRYRGYGRWWVHVCTWPRNVRCHRRPST